MLSVKLLMTIRMEEHSVFVNVRAAEGTLKKVMVVPSGDLGDFLLAQRTNTMLFFPEAEQLSSTPQVIRHLNVQTMFKVHFPAWVERVGFCFYLDVGCEVRGSRPDERPSLVIKFTLECPVAVFNGFEVFGSDPFFPFVGMPSFGPPPECLKDGLVYLMKSVAAGDMLMIVGPSLDDWIEQSDE